MRTILHCDLNNFYASVECLDSPDLADKPVAVGGNEESRHGIILAKNMLAKQKGVKTGEALWQAKQKCPGLIILPPHMEKYIRFSEMAREVYLKYATRMESFGIDECWLDITAKAKTLENAEIIANEIRETIKKELGITISVGVSYNKIFAKLGSDMKKPDAVTVITPQNFKEKVWPLPADDLLFVGRATKRKLGNLNIFTIGDIAQTHIEILKDALGKWGQTVYEYANGLDSSPVSYFDEHSEVKSIGNSITTPRDLVNINDIKQVFYVLCESVAFRLRKHGLKGNTIQIHIRSNNLDVIERQSVLPNHCNTCALMIDTCMELFKKSYSLKTPVRSLGVRMTGLIPENEDSFQLSLFEAQNPDSKYDKLERKIDDIRGRYGHHSIHRAIELRDSELQHSPIDKKVVHSLPTASHDKSLE